MCVRLQGGVRAHDQPTSQARVPVRAVTRSARDQLALPARTTANLRRSVNHALLLPQAVRHGLLPRLGQNRRLERLLLHVRRRRTRRAVRSRRRRSGCTFSMLGFKRRWLAT
ncbi:hypothetical protein RI054_40g146930 [Pseudoscourfieldia marina]